MMAARVAVAGMVGRGGSIEGLDRNPPFECWLELARPTERVSPTDQAGDTVTPEATAAP